MAPKPFAIRIFLADGTVDGVKIIAKSKWSGRVMVIPRLLLSHEKEREELNAPGVYVLIDPAAADGLTIGAADQVSHCLVRLATGTESWTSAIVVSSKRDQLNQGQFEYIAARLQQLADPARLDAAAVPCLDAAGQVEAEEFLAQMLSIYPVLGLTVFEPVNG